MTYTYAQLDLLDLNFLRSLSHIEFANKIRTIAAAFAVHEGYQVPWPLTIPAPPELMEIADHHIAITNEAETGNRIKRAERDAHRPLAAQQMAMTVQWAIMRSIRENNPSLIMNLSIEPKTRATTRSTGHPTVAAPTNLKVTQGLSGSVNVKTAKAKGGVTYHVWICQGDPTVEENWVEAAQSPYCSQDVNSLEPGKLYYFRVRCFGASGHGPWSAIASLMVI